MVESRAPRFAPRGGRLIALVAVASLGSGCVVASLAPGSSQATSSTSPAPTKLGASAVSSAPSASSGAIVSWVDRPAPAYVEPTPHPYPTDARPCRANDLEVSAGDVGARAGCSAGVGGGGSTLWGGRAGPTRPGPPPLSPPPPDTRPPPPAAPGQTLAYTVPLPNAGSTDVRLSPSPAYDEFVGSAS